MSIDKEAKKTASDIEKGAKDLGSDIGDFAKDAKDSTKEFFEKQETKDKLKSIEGDVRSTRDRIKETFKDENKQNKVNEAIDKLNDCSNNLKQSSPEEFENKANQISDSLKAIREAPGGSDIEVAGDCSVKIIGADGHEL